MLIVKEIEKNSIASELGIEKGDSITHFDNHKVVDILDYLYYNSLNYFSMTIKTIQGESVTIDIEKDDDETLGLTFESDNMQIKTCKNKCIFCFVDQMPKNMRKSLYVKDDDYRQSFTTGNYVTLTNVNDSDIERIIRLKLSPLYVSVQVVNPEIRIKMLNNRFAGDIFEKLKKLTDGGIKVVGQIVLVPSVNDGVFLEDSIRKLYSLRPNFMSLSVVPCGITKYREGLFPIRDITQNYSKCVIEQVKMLNSEFNENFVKLGDEFYFRAGLPVENSEFYGDYLDVGNGVGTTRKFSDELNLALKPFTNNKKYLIITGESVGEYFNSICKNLQDYGKGVDIKVLAVKNNFFGETVNCTGLLTGIDIVNAVKNYSEEFDILVLANVCLRDGEDVFLDDMTLKEFQNKINKTIYITDGSGESFFDAVSDGERVRKLKL